MRNIISCIINVREAAHGPFVTRHVMKVLARHLLKRGGLKAQVHFFHDALAGGGRGRRDRHVQQACIRRNAVAPASSPPPREPSRSMPRKMLSFFAAYHPFLPSGVSVRPTT